jgi:hypothetical protein
MTTPSLPFAVPARLSKNLRRVLDYWDNLKRGENSIPFWDDLKLSSLPDLANHLFLIDVFESPPRMRFNSVGEHIRERYGSDLADRFVDEVSAKPPFEFLASQAIATIEAKAPTFFAGGARRSAYERLLLPMWGNGRIGMLLGAIDDKT